MEGNNLEARTYEFALNCRNFLRLVPKSIENFEYKRQLIRSSGSVAANYIEANEGLSYKDFVHRIRICRKEVKESCLWLRLLLIADSSELIGKKESLLNEALELTRIFSATINSCEKKLDSKS